MIRAGDTENARERTDLRREYRPIGIGAVAAALTVTNKSAENHPQTAANSNDKRRANGSLAA